MFRTSIVHLQERSYAVCCNLVCLDTLWGWRKNCSSSFTLITTGRIETYQIATYSIRTLLKMDYWSPKHVELLNVMNTIKHQILCILLDYRYIVPKWVTWDIEPEHFKANKTGTVPGNRDEWDPYKSLTKKRGNKKRWYLLLCKDYEWRTGTGR